MSDEIKFKVGDRVRSLDKNYTFNLKSPDGTVTSATAGLTFVELDDEDCAPLAHYDHELDLLPINSRQVEGEERR